MARILTCLVALATLASAAVAIPNYYFSKGIESESSQEIYKLPRDNALHGGDFYKSNDLMECKCDTVYHFLGYRAELIEYDRQIDMLQGSTLPAFSR
jgi:hypothetical protein